MRFPSLLGTAACALSVMISAGQTQAASGVSGEVKCSSFCFITNFQINGSINAETSAQFSGLIDEARRRGREQGKEVLLEKTGVSLNSPGGTISAAVAIGRLMRKERFIADIAKGAECNSACVLIYAGAVVRYGHYNAGKVGIHQPYFQVPKSPIEADEVRRRYASMLYDLRAYLKEMNVSEQLADEMLKTSPENIRYLTSKDQNRFGLTIFDPVDEEISALTEAQRLGINRREYSRRKTLAGKRCVNLDLGFVNNECYNEIMSTGIAPEPADLSSFGTPARR